jgi:transcriptional regulator with XRE-family HTH domain
MGTSMKRKHTACTLKEKLKVLNRLDKGESAAKLAVEFGVGKATISYWKKNIPSWNSSAQRLAKCFKIGRRPKFLSSSKSIKLYIMVCSRERKRHTFMWTSCARKICTTEQFNEW